MNGTAPNLTNMAARRVMHDERSLDFYVVVEIRAQMARIAAQRAAEGDPDPQFTSAELADMVDVLTADQLRRRMRGEANILLADLEQLAEALEIEPFALLKAAVMRKRKALGWEPKRLRDQVIEGPAGLPTIQ